MSVTKSPSVGLNGFYVTTSHDNADARAYPATVTGIPTPDHVNLTVFATDETYQRKGVPVSNEQEVSTEGVFIFSLDQLTEASPVEQPAEPVEEKAVDPNATLGTGAEKTED